MPTNFASNATAPRIRSASARSVSSASGSATRRRFRVVEPRLEDELCGDLVANGPAFLRAHARLRQRHLGALRRVALVDARDLEAEASLELAGEALGARRHLVRRAIGVQG